MRSPSGLLDLIARGASEQAATLKNHADRDGGCGDINSAVDQGSMPPGHKPLMELVGQGIQANDADAP